MIWQTSSLITNDWNIWNLQCFADRAHRNADNLARHRSWSVCSGRVDKDLTPLIHSCNVCIQHPRCRTYCSAQHPELLAFFRTFWHSMLDDLSHTEPLHRKVESSVSYSAHELQFPPTSLSSAMQLPPKSILAPLLCFCTDNVSALTTCCGFLYEVFCCSDLYAKWVNAVAGVWILAFACEVRV